MTNRESVLEIWQIRGILEKKFEEEWWKVFTKIFSENFTWSELENSADKKEEKFNVEEEEENNPDRQEGG